MPVSTRRSQPQDPGGHTSKILFDKYEVGRLLGCGAFAKFYHARHVISGQSVTIKRISKLGILKSGLVPNIKCEISIMHRLHHPHIVRLIEVLATRTKIYFVMELVKGGELFACISNRGRMPENTSCRLFQELVSAVGFCHARGVYHQDLKLENLLLDETGRLKVSDFRLSAVSDQIRSDGLFHTLAAPRPMARPRF